MEKEFVPYELAVKLKVLGFNEPCFGHFGSITEPEELQIFPNTESCLEPEDMINSNLDYGLSCTAPTFSQAFRWFREKYELIHHIWSGKLNHIFYGYDILNIEEQELVVNNSDIGGGDCDYDTYEEAELACLQKLIEIVEQKEK